MKIATSFSKQVVPPRKKCKSSVVWEQRKRELVCALSLSRSSFLSLSLSVFIQGKRKEHQQVSPYVYEGNQDTFNPSSVFSTFFFSAFLRFFFSSAFYHRCLLSLITKAHETAYFEIINVLPSDSFAFEVAVISLATLSEVIVV